MTPTRRPPPATSAMSATELATALDEIGWTTGELGRRAGTSRQFIQKLVQGQRPVPVRVAVFVREVRAALSRVAAIQPQAADDLAP